MPLLREMDAYVLGAAQGQRPTTQTSARCTPCNLFASQPWSFCPQHARWLPSTPPLSAPPHTTPANPANPTLPLPAGVEVPGQADEDEVDWGEERDTAPTPLRRPKRLEDLPGSARGHLGGAAAAGPEEEQARQARRQQARVVGVVKKLQGLGAQVRREGRGERGRGGEERRGAQRRAPGLPCCSLPLLWSARLYWGGSVRAPVLVGPPKLCDIRVGLAAPQLPAVLAGVDLAAAQAGSCSPN
jgi:hypothetical protein